MKLLNLIYIVSLTLVFSTSFAIAQLPGSLSKEDEKPDLEMDFTENPCPDPRAALSKTPNDLKVIQEDITRFTLCLQRAQLLARLNDLAEENVESLNASLDQRLETIAEKYTPEPMVMPEIAMPEMPSIISDDFIQEDGQTVTDTQIEPGPIVIEEPKQHTNWTIREIKGQNGVLFATLDSVDGALANIKAGETIPETEIYVTEVTQIGVKVREGNDSAKLKWSQ